MHLLSRQEGSPTQGGTKLPRKSGELYVRIAVRGARAVRENVAKEAGGTQFQGPRQ